MLEDTERELMQEIIDLEWTQKKLENEKEIWDLSKELGKYSKRGNEEVDEDLKEEWKRVQMELDELLEDEGNQVKELKELENELVNFEKDRMAQETELKLVEKNIQFEEGEIKKNQQKLNLLKRNESQIGELDGELEYLTEEEQKLKMEIQGWEQKIFELSQTLEEETQKTKEVARRIKREVEMQNDELQQTIEK
jgi:chromosome segregation ATPase